MKYFSTRDRTAKLYSFSDILLKGLADDGGLYVPANYPQVSIEQLSTFKQLSYATLAAQVMFPFVEGSLSYEQLLDLTTKTYQPSVFGSEVITPLEQLQSNIYIQDLSSGPSLAFKDMAMQFLGHLMEFELHRQGRQLTILGASSGDTVSAAEQAMRSKAAIKVVMLTPKEGMSPFQKAQAGSILDDNICNISIDGPFDCCQDLVKEVNSDLDFKTKYSIGAVNSINWGRILAQIVYYFKGYLTLASALGDPIDVCVPSGNFGNVLAAYIAQQMGLPLRRLIVSTNENVVLDEFFKTGIYQQRPVEVTSSPSMDISKASNIERLFFDLVNRKGDVCQQMMQQFSDQGRLDLSEYQGYLASKCGFFSGCSNHQQRLDTICEVYAKSQRIIDPHTAAGVFVAQRLNTCDNTPIICMETAKPAKFEQAIEEALDFIPKRPTGFENLESQDQRFYSVDATAVAVKEFIAKRFA
tara:strand:- start:262 stop:1668 length:1407 start_codon:yes stop_codon:yes gene_type:complete